ncbi:MAG: hypothetical protein JRJ29_19735, partial [Deltaproteobacteria bacterium]|nr:hypothetical protein [Deltaproteobacteria bacterium]
MGKGEGRMKKNLKVLAFGLLILLFVLISTLLATGLIIYYNPSSIKPLLENYLSAVTGGRVRIRTLCYSINPLSVRGEGISLVSKTEQGELSLEIPFLEAEMALEGPFAGRRLIVRHLQAKGVSLQANNTLEAIRIPTKDRALRTGLLQRIRSLLLFRDMSWRSAEITGGRINVEQDFRVLRADNIRVNVASTDRISISGRVSILLPKRKTEFSSTSLHVELRSAGPLLDREISGTLAVECASLKDPAFVMEGIKVQARLGYSGKTKSLAIHSLEVDSPGLIFKEGPFSPKKGLTFHLEGRGKLPLKERTLERGAFMIVLDSRHRLGGTISADLSNGIEIRLPDLRGQVFPAAFLHDI